MEEPIRLIFSLLSLFLMFSFISYCREWEDIKIMKADEYAEKYKQYLVNPPKDLWKGRPEDARWDKTDALIAICHDLFFEITDIMLNRRAQSDLALLAVLREQDQKWIAILRRLNDSEIKITGFRAFVKSQMPDLAKALGW